METLADAKNKRAYGHHNANDLNADEAVIYAALDLGTNNCRLLIAAPVYKAGALWPTLKILDSYSRIVRLGEGLGTKGELSADAMARTIKALKVCRSKLRKYGNIQFRFVATEACRRATNAQEFLRKVREEADMDIEVISNEEEAKLAFYGCSSLLNDTSQKALTFDIGGGSTEFMWTSRKNAEDLPDILGWASIPYGVMNISEQFGGTAFTEMYFDEIVAKIAEPLQRFDQKHDISSIIGNQEVQLLSTSGTVTTLAAIHLDLPRYDRSKVDGICVKMADLRASTQKLMNMPASARYQHPCIGNQRADYIISGCAILEAIYSTWPFSHITIADRGVREGIIMSLILHPNQSFGAKQ